MVVILDPVRPMLALLLLSLSLSHQVPSFNGTYAIQGGQVPITLTLRQAANGAVTGTLQGNTRFDIQARLKGSGQFEGHASNASGRIYIAGQLDASSGNLGLIMAEVGPDGQPQLQSAQQVVAMRTAGEGRGNGNGARGKGDGAMGQPGGEARAPGAVATSPADRQLAQLLTSSAWCSFSYSGAGGGSASGTTHTERVIFRANGTGARSTGSESYYSNPNGSAYGSGNGGGAFQWRLANGVLLATDQSGQTSQIPLQVTRNSNGYPIITASGTEYSQCN